MFHATKIATGISSVYSVAVLTKKDQVSITHQCVNVALFTHRGVPDQLHT